MEDEYNIYSACTGRRHTLAAVVVLPGSHLSTCVTFGDAGKFCRLMTDTLLTPRTGDVCTTMACCEEYAPMHRVQQMHGKQEHNQALLVVKDSREVMQEQQSVIVATKVSFASFSGGSWLFGRTPAALPRFLTAISVAAAILDRQWGTYLVFRALQQARDN